MYAYDISYMHGSAMDNRCGVHCCVLNKGRQFLPNDHMCSQRLASMTRCTGRPTSSPHDRAMAYEPRAEPQPERSPGYSTSSCRGVPNCASGFFGADPSKPASQPETGSICRTACNSYSRNVTLVNTSPRTSEIHLTAVSL